LTKPRNSPHRAFALKLEAEPGVDAIKAVRALLKVALRRFELRCIDVRECERALVCPSPRSHPIRETSMSKFSERIRSQKTGMFRVADFAGGRETTLTVDHLEESVAMFQKEIDLLHFRETKQTLQLNVTNSEFLLNALGDDPATWPGQKIVLYLGTYTYGDDTGHTIKIKLREAPKPEAPASKPTSATTGVWGENTATPIKRARTPTTKPTVDPKLDDEIPF
jgi:hypothetical protein